MLEVGGLRLEKTTAETLRFWGLEVGGLRLEKTTADA
jgi:hypothetical protein